MPRGGSRERRRIAAIQRRLDAGEDPYSFDSRTVRKYPELFSPFLGPAGRAAFGLAPRSPRDSSETRTPSRSRSPAPLPPTPVTRGPIALDLHNVLDQGRTFNPARPVPDSTIAAIRKLREFRFVPWILTWIGSQGPQSSERRRNAEWSREYIASQLGLEFPKGSHPRPEGIFLKICDFKTGIQGKAHFCQHLSTFLILDDNFEICKD